MAVSVRGGSVGQWRFLWCAARRLPLFESSIDRLTDTPITCQWKKKYQESSASGKFFENFFSVPQCVVETSELEKHQLCVVVGYMPNFFHQDSVTSDRNIIGHVGKICRRVPHGLVFLCFLRHVVPYSSTVRWSSGQAIVTDLSIRRTFLRCAIAYCRWMNWTDQQSCHKSFVFFPGTCCCVSWKLSPQSLTT